MLSRYRGRTICTECKGSRLRKEASYVTVGKLTIAELVMMPVAELKLFFEGLKLGKKEKEISERLLKEIGSRLDFLCSVGLGYLTLNRLSSTLSGGESQRINLATSLGSSLVGSLYILDEPSIGLHSRDTDQLIGVLRSLQQLGNTVVIVEHDEEIIRSADHVIDMGPLAGRHGGEVVFQGDHKELLKEERSLTARYMNGLDQIQIPSSRRKWNNFLEIKGARENNLRGIDVRFPLNVFTVVTGVSGSGKSSLISSILYPSDIIVCVICERVSKAPILPSINSKHCIVLHFEVDKPQLVSYFLGNQSYKSSSQFLDITIRKDLFEFDILQLG